MSAAGRLILRLVYTSFTPRDRHRHHVEQHAKSCDELSRCYRPARNEQPTAFNTWLTPELRLVRDGFTTESCAGTRVVVLAGRSNGRFARATLQPA
jgi:hypothetical protein